MPFFSPLRYPGGKRKILPYLKKIIKDNNITLTDYVEPYAGGSAVALDLLFFELTNKIHINDMDHSIYSFWYSILNETDRFCEEISVIDLSFDEWKKQKSIQNTYESTFELGFSTFYLNRTNRSGIINGGVIGGKEQNGDYLLDARFNKENLIKRIRKISRHKSQIEISNLDAVEFMKLKSPNISKQSSLFYLDPPYFINGRKLYKNFYEEKDHEKIRNYLLTLTHNWLVSYDNVPKIRELYGNFQMQEYSLSYTANQKVNGKEIMIFSNNLKPVGFITTTL